MIIDKARLYFTFAYLVDMHDLWPNIELVQQLVLVGVGAAVEPHHLRHRQPKHRDRQQ